MCINVINLTFRSGSHEISLTVHGKGVMGHLVKSLLRGFNVKHAVNDLASNLREYKPSACDVTRYCGNLTPPYSSETIAATSIPLALLTPV